MKLLRITVSGHVQGVSFRAGAQAVAKRLGLSGFVRNQPDGTVYIEAEGSEPALEQFLAWCRTGPSHAAVRTISHTEHPPAGHRGFTIR